ncbi:MAG: hypothetical protein ABIW85_04175 [Variovorax sp.]
MSTVISGTSAARATTTIDILGESAMWCSRDDVLYWVDIRAPLAGGLFAVRVDASGLPEPRFGIAAHRA